jgi:hypothetical protein
MLAANSAVTAMLDGGRGKAQIWRINADDGYHEEIDEVATIPRAPRRPSY